MHPIITELLNKGFEVRLTLDQNLYCYTLVGFYKSGAIHMYEASPNGDHLCAWDRDATPRTIENFSDLVQLNYEWWINSRSRHERWKDPDAAWIPHMIELGLIKKTTQPETVYESIND